MWCKLLVFIILCTYQRVVRSPWSNGRPDNFRVLGLTILWTEGVLPARDQLQQHPQSVVHQLCESVLYVSRQELSETCNEDQLIIKNLQ